MLGSNPSRQIRTAWQATPIKLYPSVPHTVNSVKSCKMFPRASTWILSWSSHRKHSARLSPTQLDSAGPCIVSRCRLVDEMRMTVGKLSHRRNCSKPRTQRTLARYGNRIMQAIQRMSTILQRKWRQKYQLGLMRWLWNVSQLCFKNFSVRLLRSTHGIVGPGLSLSRPIMINDVFPVV